MLLVWSVWSVLSICWSVSVCLFVLPRHYCVVCLIFVICLSVSVWSFCLTAWSVYLSICVWVSLFLLSFLVYTVCLSAVLIPSFNAFPFLSFPRCWCRLVAHITVLFMCYTFFTCCSFTKMLPGCICYSKVLTVLLVNSYCSGTCFQHTYCTVQSTSSYCTTCRLLLCCQLSDSLSSLKAVTVLPVNSQTHCAAWKLLLCCL